MHPLSLILLGLAVAVGVTVFKTVKAAKTLSFNVLRFGLYQFNNDGRLVFRITGRKIVTEYDFFPSYEKELQQNLRVGYNDKKSFPLSENFFIFAKI